MPKFITVTKIHDSKQIDVNMDMIESFSKADDALGGTKLYSPQGNDSETADMRGYWHVKETPEQIREKLNTSTSVVTVMNSAPRKPPVTTPLEYEVDGCEVDDGELIQAVRAWRGTAVKNNRDSVRLDKLQAVTDRLGGVGLYAAKDAAGNFIGYSISADGTRYVTLRAAIDALKD